MRSGKSLYEIQASLVFSLYPIRQLSQANPASVSRQSYALQNYDLMGFHALGKTVFLTYVLLRRLMSGLTTIYCDSKTNAYIFDDMGVRRETISDELRISELDHNARCCALVNLGDKLASVPPVFYPETRVGRVVVATPPVEKHWSTFSHENTARVCCMPTWSWGPLYFAR